LLIPIFVSDAINCAKTAPKEMIIMPVNLVEMDIRYKTLNALLLLK